MWTERLCDPTCLSMHSQLVFGLVGTDQLLHITPALFCCVLRIHFKSSDLKKPGNATEKSAPGAELRCKYSDSRSGAQLIPLIEKIHDINS
jgi:hypothetical protein